jgi:hypothetical protein
MTGRLVPRVRRMRRPLVLSGRFTRTATIE